MKKNRLPMESARRIALNAQMLLGDTDLPKGKEGIARTIERLGYVQIEKTSPTKIAATLRALVKVR